MYIYIVHISIWLWINTYTIFRGLFTSILTQLNFDVVHQGYYWFFTRWAMIFLGLFIITGGILLGGLLQSYTSDPTVDPERRFWVWRHYGTASRVPW